MLVNRSAADPQRRCRRLARRGATSSACACSAPSRPASRRSQQALARAIRDALEPRVRAPLHADRATAGRAVDELGVHAHRAHPLLVRGLPRGAREPRAVLGHRRVHDRASSTRSTSGRPQPGSRSSSTDRTTFRSSAASTSPGGTTGSASSRRSAAGCTSATSSTRGRAGAPWLVVEGPLERAGRARGGGRRCSRCCG